MENRNPYLKHLQKIEFVVTDACTGRCKHCSAGDHKSFGERIDPTVAADAVRRVAELYPIKTVMTFGGEPLLCPDAVCAIMTAAREREIPHRQVITNGFFTGDSARIREMAERLADCGVNDLLLSVDAFHRETIPIEPVRDFAYEVKRCGIPIRLSPAWLVSPADDNPYNNRTRELLDGFRAIEIPVGNGNVIFPEGNALKYLADYFVEAIPENPYVEDPHDVRTLSFSANGDVLDGNVYRTEIGEILMRYQP